MQPSRKSHIQHLVTALCQGLHEREETVSVALLGALTGQNTFLFGPPGTAKSLMARRIASVFHQASFFECLMNRFSTPEEVFGPVSIQALKQDQYLRKTDGYLPKVDFAFLDEIWKSSPAILNTLLTLINERLFRNGDEVDGVPLKALIAASNEVPEADQGLEALYDRFLIRLLAAPTDQWDNFASLLQSAPASAEAELPDEEKIQGEQWSRWQMDLHQVSLAPDTLAVIKSLKASITEQQEALGLYISDRRWQRAATLLKASAFFCDRTSTNHSDVLLLRHCLWAQEEHRAEVQTLVEGAVFRTACPTELDLVELYEQIDQWDLQLNQVLFYPDDVYETQEFYPQQYFFGGKEERSKDQANFFYVKAVAKHQFASQKEPIYFDFYVHQEQMKSRKVFHPMDTLGKSMDNVQCQWDDNGFLNIVYAEFGNFDSSAYLVNPFKPKVLFSQGERREDINEIEFKTLIEAIAKAKQDLTQALAQVKAYQADYQTSAETPFVPEGIRAVALGGLIQQIGDIELHIKHCERLEALGE